MKYYNYPNTTEVAEDVDSKNISDFAPGGGGSGAGVMRVGRDAQANTLDKTWQEISDCFANGGYAYIAISPGPGMTVAMPIVGIGGANAQYFVMAISPQTMDTVNFVCSSPNEYPAPAEVND